MNKMQTPSRPSLLDTPAGIFAALIHARKNGDVLLATEAEIELLRRYGVRISFAPEIKPESREATA